MAEVDVLVRDVQSPILSPILSRGHFQFVSLLNHFHLHLCETHCKVNHTHLPSHFHLRVVQKTIPFLRDPYLCGLSIRNLTPVAFRNIWNIKHVDSILISDSTYPFSSKSHSIFLLISQATKSNVETPYLQPLRQIHSTRV